MLVMPARGAGEDRSLLSTDRLQVPIGWSRDGKFLLFVKRSPAEDVEVWALAEGSDPPADVFFLHPTTYFWRGGWNAPVGGFLTRLITAVTLDGQASAFEQAGRIFAPRFRQMTLSGFDRAEVRTAAE